MNNNLEFENEDPSPDSIEDNHPRTNYGEGYYVKETLEEAGAIAAGLCEHLEAKEQAMFIAGFQVCLWWQQERRYSEEEVKHIVSEALQSALVKVDLEQWFKQFKKK